MNTITNEQDNEYEIYIIKNILDGKAYIGVAKKYIKGNRNKYYIYGGIGRFKRHISNAFSKNEKCSNDCPLLYDAIRHYGSELFIFHILRCINKTPKEYEKKYILKFNTHDPNFGYNVLISTEKPICQIQLAEFQKKKADGNINRAINGTMKKKEHSKNLPPNINYRTNSNKTKKHEGYFVQIKINGILYNKAFMSDTYSLDQKLKMAIEYLDNIKKCV
jgi:hypothetical protein